MIHICSLVASSTTLTARYVHPCIHSNSPSLYLPFCSPFHLTDLTVPSLTSAFYICFTRGFTPQSSLCVLRGLLHFILYLYVQLSVTSFPHQDVFLFSTSDTSLSLTLHWICLFYLIFFHHPQTPCQDRVKILAVTHREVLLEMHSAH